MLAGMTTTDPVRGAHSSRPTEDLGIVDGLVQLSFLVQGILARAADGYDLTVVQIRLLGVLRDREPGMSQLARLLGLDKSSATGLVDRAARRGLVTRNAVPGDRRAATVALTDAGRRIAEEIAAEVDRQLNQAVSGLTDTGRKRLSLLASRVVRHEAAGLGLDPGHTS